MPGEVSMYSRQLEKRGRHMESSLRLGRHCLILTVRLPETAKTTLQPTADHLVARV